MSDNYLNQVTKDEISVEDVINFFLESWKVILVTGLIGILGAAGFIAVMPSQYEATARIQMMQIGSVSNTTNPLGVNLEDPNLIIARLKLPSSYEFNQVKACGIDQENYPNELLVGLVKLEPVKGVSSIVELKIRMQSKDHAINCAQAVFYKIRDSQNAIMKPHIEEAKVLLKKYQIRLLEAQSIIGRADKAGDAFSAVYLINRDEMKFLTDESIRLNAFISSSETRQAKLVAPIYASDIPVFPKKKISLLMGLLAGLFLGVFIVMVRKFWRGYRGLPSGVAV